MNRRFGTRARLATVIGLAIAIAPLAAFADDAPVAEPYGLAAMWNGGDLVARATLIVLVAMSIANWYAVIARSIERAILIRRIKGATRVVREAPSLEAAHRALPERSAARALLGDALEADRAWDRMPEGTVDRHTWIGGRLRAGIARTLGGGAPTIAATVGSTSPFVGLFGTVWGIHHALTEIGVTGQASIDRVAGPVGEALTMTAIGLVVAVPAVIGHNWLLRQERTAGAAVRGLATMVLDAVLLSRAAEERRRPRPAAVGD